MPVNANVWGTPAQWRNELVTAYDIETSFKSSKFKEIGNIVNDNSPYGTSSLGFAIYYDIIDSKNNEIDSSISPWNISNDSILFNPTIVTVKNDMIVEGGRLFRNSYGELLISRNSLNLNSGNNYAFDDENIDRTYSLSPYNFDAIFKFGQSKESILSPSGIQLSSSYSLTRIFNNRFITDFNYRDIVLLGKIIAVSDIDTLLTATDYTIDSYFNTNAKDTHPYIVGISFTPYIKYKDEDNVTKYHEAANFIQLINNSPANSSIYEVYSNYKSTPDNTESKYRCYNGYYTYFNSTHSRFNNYNEYYQTVYNMPTKPILTDGLEQYTPMFNISEKFVSAHNRISSKLTQVFCYSTTLTRDDVIKEIAYLGFWFTTHRQGIEMANQNKFGESDLLCLPVFNSSNTTTGKYEKGVEAKKLPNFNYSNNIVNSTDLFKSGDTGDLTTNINTNKAGGNRRVFF